MFFYTCSRRLLSLLFINTLLLSSASPSFANAGSIEQTAQLPIQQLAERYGLSSGLDVSDESYEDADDSMLLTQSDFLRSAHPFFEQARLVLAREASTFESFTQLHSIAVEHLSERIANAITETNQLIAAAQRSQQTAPRITSYKPNRPIRPLLRSQQKSFLANSQANSQSAIAAVKQQDSSAQEIQSAYRQLRDAGIDLTSADGTFNPEQPLTREAYLRYLQQVDQLLVEVQYGRNAGIDSVLSVNSIEAVTEFNKFNKQMKRVLADLSKVAVLHNELRRAIEDKSNHAYRAKSDFTNAAAGKNEKNNSSLFQIVETSQTEEMVTQGEFAMYVTSQVTQILSSNNTFVAQERLISTATHYAEMRGHLTLMIDELEAATAQLNEP